MNIEQRIQSLQDGLSLAHNGDSVKLHDLLIVAAGIMLDMAHEITALKQATPEATMPKACRKQECDYYTHYEVYYDPQHNGSKLPHAAYHAAVEKCLEVQERSRKWYDEHPTGTNEALDEQCDFWERRVAA